MYGDNLEFSTPQLEELIGILEEVKATIQASKNNYVDYVNNQLSPNWTTEGGRKTVSELINFADTNIQSFITYLDNNIANLESAKNGTARIDVA